MTNQDGTENLRRAARDYVNDMGPPAGATTWSTEELQRDFEVEGFMAPYVVVRRRSDGQRGTLLFTHRPRVYFNFAEAQ